MKKFRFLLGLCMCLSCLSGCRAVVVNSADELTFRSWEAETLSGVRAELKFEVNSASLVIYDAQGEVLADVRGALAIDGENFYITDDSLCKTFDFGYTVYGDKAEVTYLGESLTFYPCTTADATE